MLTKEKLELMNEASLSGGGTVPTNPGGSECSTVDLTEVSQLAFQVEATFNGDASSGIAFHVRASSDGGTDPANWDTVDYDSATLPCDAGNRAQMTFPVAPDPLYVTVLAVNLDGVYSATNVKVTRIIQQVEPL